MTVERIRNVLFVQEGYVKELKIKLIFSNFQTCCLEVCSLTICTLPYIYFLLICLVLSFGIKKELLEKKLNTFFIGSEHP